MYKATQSLTFLWWASPIRALSLLFHPMDMNWPWDSLRSFRERPEEPALTSGMLRGALCKDTTPPLEDDGFCAGEPMVTTVSKAVWDLWASCITDGQNCTTFFWWRQNKVHPAHPDWADPQDNRQAHDLLESCSLLGWGCLNTPQSLWLSVEPVLSLRPMFSLLGLSAWSLARLVPSCCSGIRGRPPLLETTPRSRLSIPKCAGGCGRLLSSLGAWRLSCGRQPSLGPSLPTVLPRRGTYIDCLTRLLNK